MAMAAHPATELRDIDVMRVDDSVVVRILGDGEFSYETLSLEGSLSLRHRSRRRRELRAAQRL